MECRSDFRRRPREREGEAVAAELDAWAQVGGVSQLPRSFADRIFIRLSDPKQAYYAQEAREFLRKRLIGKHVKVHVDFVRPREGEYEERECATIRYGGQNLLVAMCMLTGYVN